MASLEDVSSSVTSTVGITTVFMQMPEPRDPIYNVILYIGIARLGPGHLFRHYRDTVHLEKLI
jgi:hypothetical protein